MIYLILLLPLAAHADFFDLSEDELNPDSEEVLIKKPEKYLRHESMIYDLDTDLGIKDQRRYTGEDRNRFSIAGHVSGNYEQLGDLYGGDVAYLRRSTRYHQLWWGVQYFQHRTYFDAITQNPANRGTNSEGSFARPGDVRNTVQALGLGVGCRFKLLLEFFPTEDVFENIEVFVNGVQLNESYVDREYRGFGLTANYGIHKRTSTSFFWGAKMSYNVASVSRRPIVNEPRSTRSLALGWPSFGLELGVFF
jgi:hypothetical protein